MKNISLALNVLLIIAVAILYYLHFSNNQTELVTVSDEIIADSTEVVVEEEIDLGKIDSKIAYLNVDSLQEKYKLYADLVNKLKSREKRYEKELAAKSAVFEKKVMDFQKNAATMTQFEGQTKQKDLAEQEQKLYKIRDEYAVKFQNEEIKLNNEFQAKVKGFIRKYNESADYNLVIGSSQLGNRVLYHNEGINITNEIVDGLNQDYNKEKEAKTNK